MAHAAAHRDDDELESAGLYQILEVRARLATGRYDGLGFTAEAMDHEGRVDAAAAGGFPARSDVCPIFEDQPIHSDGAIDGGIYGKCDDQALILAECAMLP